MACGSRCGVLLRIRCCERCFASCRGHAESAGACTDLADSRFTDVRRGIDGLGALVQTALSSNPVCGDPYIFRGRCSDRLKLLWHDTDGMCLSISDCIGVDSCGRALVTA